MCDLNNLTPHQKKDTLILLIDDMTAAAIDRSSQGYANFLQCRNQLLNTIDSLIQIDLKREAIAKQVAIAVNEYFTHTDKKDDLQFTLNVN